MISAAGKFMSEQLFGGSALQGLISGNVTQEEARVNLLDRSLWKGVLQECPCHEKRVPDGQIDLSLLTRQKLMEDTLNFRGGDISAEHYLRALIMQGSTLNEDDPSGAVQVVLQVS